MAPACEQVALMTSNYLRLRFQDDGDGTGKLIARAEADGYSGEGSAYFNIDRLEEFAKAIGAFPLPSSDERRSITGGFGKKDGDGDWEHEHLGIAVYPADALRGYIGIQVRMATEVWQATRPESQKTARIEVVTTYEPLSRFSRDLLSLLNGTIKEALLEGQSIV
jgi:hypothetical protein